MHFIKSKFYTLSILATLFIFGLTAAGPLTAHPLSDEQGSINGTVTDAQGEPLAGVNITFPQLNRGTVTETDGRYRIQNLPTGTYTVVFSFIGFAKENKSVQVVSNETITVDATLQQQSLQAETITVTGSPNLSDPLTTPSDVDVLAGAEKLAAQQTSLGATLDELAGITTISTGSQVGKPVIRGLSGNRIRVLKNGTPQEYQQFGVRHTPNLDPFSVDRIEVVRGAASVQYGSDAIGGAINAISGEIPNALDQDAFLSGEALTEYATNNNEFASGLKLEGAAGHWGFRGNFIRRSGGNIQTPDVPTFRETDDTTAPVFSDELNNTDFDQLSGTFSLGYSAQAYDITTEFSHWQNDYNFLLPNGMGLGQYLQNNSLTVKGDIKPGNSWIINPSFTYSRNLRQSSPGGAEAVPRTELNDDNLAVDILRKTYTNSLTFEHPTLGIFSGQFGIEYKRDEQTISGFGPFVPAGTKNNYSAFIFEKVDLNKLTLSVGGRIDFRDQQVEPNEQLELPDRSAGETNDVLDQSYRVATGSLGANYQFTENLAVSANVGTGFRSPSFFNLHANGVEGGVAAFQIGDPGLEPERSLNTDFSVRWRSQTVQAKATVYRNRIDNYIFLINTGEFIGPNGEGPPILRSIQTEATLRGADASVKARVLPWLQLSSTFETVIGDNEETDEALPLLPPTRWGGNVRFSRADLGGLENAFINLGVNHTYSKDAAGPFEPFFQFGNAPQFSDFGVASTDAYTLFNLGFGFDIPVANQPVSFQLQAKNLFNTAYRDFLDTYKGYALNPGRNITIKVNVPFSLL